VGKLRDWLGRAVPVLLVLAGVVVVAAVVFILPARLARSPKSPITPAERLKAENDVRTTLIQALGGAALLSGVYFTARTLKVNREGQITERFTRAIDQLGNQNNLDVRLGGIYALERVARDSEQDHGPIMEVLTAFLREHARWQNPDLPTKPDPDALPTRLRADFQAVARVLARRPEQRRQHEDERLDLSGVDLRNGGLIEAHLEGAILIGAHLEGALLIGAHLEGAILIWAHLEKTILSGAHLEGAILRGAHLEGADLSGAHGLVQAQLASAITNDRTELPEWS